MSTSKTEKREELESEMDLLENLNAKIGNAAQECANLSLACGELSKTTRGLLDEVSVDLQVAKHGISEFLKERTDFLKELRRFKFSVKNEVREVLSPVRDVREFFLEDDYAKQVSRLKEFTELCEKMKDLKESGFLDSVADTMLKLAKEGGAE